MLCILDIVFSKGIMFHMNETFNLFQTFFTFIIIIYSIILHEIAHGFAAYVQGDETANRAGRLTLNPLPHIDVMGSVIVPLFAFFTAGTFFGWAKPVPYNEYNIRSKTGLAFVSVAGVLTNIFLAVISILVFKLLLWCGVLNNGMSEALFTIIGVNVSLAFFNLIPIPPFDGMSIIQAIFPGMNIRNRFIYSPIYMVVAIVVGSVLYRAVVPSIFVFIQGLLF